MRVLIVSCVFPPEPIVSSQTSGELAGELAARGADVTVVTGFPNRPAGRLFDGYRRRLYSRDLTPEGYELIRCFNALSTESSIASRLLENLTFGITGAIAALTSRKPDVIYSNTWPLFASLLILLVARIRGVPIVFSIQDIYPESLVSQGRLSEDSPLARALRALDGVLMRSAAALVVISSRFRDIYATTRRVPGERITLVHNWVARDLISPVRRGTARGVLNLDPDGFLVVYGGNIGVAAGVETVVRAAALLKDDPQIRFVIAGSGSRLNDCRLLAEELGAHNVRFHSPWAREETSPLLGAADLLVLPTRGQQSLASVPSKLISYMLAGRPVLALAAKGSDLATVVEESGGGLVIDPDDPCLLARSIQEVASMPRTRRDAMGVSARDYANSHFTAETCLPRVIRVLEGAAS